MPRFTAISALLLALLGFACHDNEEQSLTAPQPDAPMPPSITASGATARILLLHGESVIDGTKFKWLEDSLVATGPVTADRIDFLQMSTIAPPLSTLLTYDCVISWTNSQHLLGVTEAHMTALGDRLKEYVVAGGGLVLAQAAFAADGAAQVRIRGGIMEEGFSPFHPGITTVPTIGPSTLDFSTARTAHPILAGVTEFSYGQAGLNWPVVRLHPGATLVATDNVGGSLIAVSASNAVAAFNVYPGPYLPKSMGVSRALVNACLLVTNQAPFANAGGPYTGAPGAPVSFTGAASSDRDGDAITYHWDFGDGTTGTGRNPSHTYSTYGSHVVTLTVTDPEGLHDRKTSVAGIMSPKRVLLLHGESVIDGTKFQWLEDSLVATGLFSADRIDFLQMSTVPPALSLLNGYDCILSWTNSQHLLGVTEAHMTALGNRLREYVVAGGGVVLAQAAFAADAAAQVRMRGGIMEDGFSPFDAAGTTLPATAARTLDFSTALTSHPILTGVSEFSYGQEGLNFPVVELDPGATLVARDNVGGPVVAVSSNRRVAGFNAYPGPYLPKSAGVNRALANACLGVSGLGVLETGATPTGTDVAASPVDPTPVPGAQTVALTFESVTTGGTTTLTTSRDEGLIIPSAFRLSEQPIIYDIESTASFSGTVRVCIDHTAPVVDPHALALLHGEPDGHGGIVWQDVTTSQEPLADGGTRVCGEVTSLSPFVVAERKLAQTITFDPVATQLLGDGLVQLNASASSGLPVAFALGPASSSSCTLTGATVTLSDVTTGPGTQCVVVATQAGSPEYAPADPVVRSFEVRYQYAGFFQPVDNPEVAVNRAKAGSAIPVKFSLDGDHGLNVLAPGSPTSGSYTCSTASEDVVEQTLTATTSGLQYDLATEQYTYVWKTDRSWASSCRTLLVTLKDGTRHTALFHFER